MLNRIRRFLRVLWTVHIKRDPFAIAYQRWLRDDAEGTLRYDYPLGPDSVVLDVGGYTGNWAARIHERYGSRIYIFEPVPQFNEALRRRFDGHAAIRVFDFGLSDRDTTMPMTVAADGSSVYQEGGTRIEVRLRDIDAVLAEENVGAIDLIKINIEGGEYALLARMLDRGIAARCRDIQVQFHDFFPNARALRAELRDRLAHTHELTYDYEFVWENWRRREEAR